MGNYTPDQIEFFLKKLENLNEFHYFKRATETVDIDLYSWKDVYILPHDDGNLYVEIVSYSDSYSGCAMLTGIRLVNPKAVTINTFQTIEEK